MSLQNKMICQYQEIMGNQLATLGKFANGKGLKFLAINIWISCCIMVIDLPFDVGNYRKRKGNE